MRDNGPHHRIRKAARRLTTAMTWSAVVDTALPNPGAGIEAVRLRHRELGLDLQRHGQRPPLAGRLALRRRRCDLEMDPPHRAARAGAGVVPLSVDDPGPGGRDPRDLHAQCPRPRDRRSCTPGSTRTGFARATTSHEGRSGSARDIAADADAGATRGRTRRRGAPGLSREWSAGGLIPGSWSACSGSAASSTTPTARPSTRSSRCSRRSSSSRRPSSACSGRHSWWSTRSTAPFAGYLVDRLSRRCLIPLGLAFWSLICAATGLSRTFGQLVLLPGRRGAGRVVLFPRLDVVPGRLSRPADPLAGPGHPPDERLPGHGRGRGAGRPAGRAVRLAVAVLGPGPGGDGLCAGPGAEPGRAAPRPVGGTEAGRARPVAGRSIGPATARTIRSGTRCSGS